MRIVYDESLRGRTVIDARGSAVGEVEALLVDTETWRADALRVRLRRDAAERIGVPHGAFRAATALVPTAIIQGVSDTVVLRVDTDALRRAAPAPTPAPPEAGPH